MATTKLTLSIDPDLLKCFKTMYTGNVSGFVAQKMKDFIHTGVQDNKYSEIEKAYKLGQESVVKQFTLDK